MKLSALTGIRAFAALAVVLYHFTRGFPPLESLFLHGYLGVDLFFILSGFIIHHVYRDTFSKGAGREDFLTFIRYRFARIYPVHFAMIAVMLCLYLIAISALGITPDDPAPYTWTALAASLTLTHGWFGAPSPNIPSWSVSAEWFAYLLYPFICVAAVRLPAAAKGALALVCIAAIGLWANLHPLARIAPEFLLGMLVYDLNQPGRFGRFAGLAVAGVIIAADLMLPIEALALRAALFAALIATLAAPSDLLGRVLGLPVFVYLGEISYSTYMTHGVLWTVVTNACKLTHTNANSWGVIGASVLIALPVSMLTYHVVELPARSLLRRLNTRGARYANP
jgi:peptidoglycan/LPS O-acetylase OafA/YrhL